jgi:hypothetical protein
MGCLGSKEANAVDNVSKGGDSDSACALDGPPDFGVDEMYEVRYGRACGPWEGCLRVFLRMHAGIAPLEQVRKLLGEGGSGQTWLCLDRAARKQVAIKFMKRPIPKIVIPMMMHEIKVGA